MWLGYTRFKTECTNLSSRVNYTIKEIIIIGQGFSKVR